MKAKPARQRSFVRDSNKRSRAVRASVSPPGGPDAAYKNPRLPIERRLKDLLSRMTLQEKAAQMLCVWQKKSEMLVGADGQFDPQKARKAFKEGHGLGQVGRPSDAGQGQDARRMAELTNAIQKFFLENTRLGVPVFFHEECLHGHAAIDGTSFPQPIGLAATFNRQLVESIYAITAHEARARGTHQALTPVVDVARDPRWGRVEETFGEDPCLVSQMGIAAVRGFQGRADFADHKRVIATLKHFAAHGQPESGINCGPAQVGERDLREIFLRPFKAGIEEAGAISVMASYNEIDGVPSHANAWLLRDVLRKEWGFKGFVVSDYYAIWELSHRPDTHGHFVAADKARACALAVDAGVNIEFPEPDCYLSLCALVRSGRIKESQLDELIAPMLYWKFKMGLFENPFVDPDAAAEIAGSEDHRPTALQAARETITLLKNDNHLVPLDPERVGVIAVIGPNADRELLGGYSGRPKYYTSVLEGIRARVGDRIEVPYSEGCKITVGGSWNQDLVAASDPASDIKQIQEAVEVAKRADVVVLVLGENEQTSREAWSKTHLGDRARLRLLGAQEALANAIVTTGKPVIVLLFNGRPLAINYLAQVAPAIFECWYPGQETGRAVAEVLFGDFNPAGKLPISIPRSAGHLPVFYNHKPSARRGYLFDEVSPLYPFGFGLSYTTFQFQNLRLARKKIRPNESTRAMINVTNTGQREGQEVVQLYIRDLVSSVTRPIRELKAFAKTTLRPGETKTVSLEITPDSLAFYDRRMEYTVEPGEFEIMAGNSSRDEDLQKTVLTVKG